MTPHVSVLLPVRNGEGMIRRAVTSTLRALPARAELLVWNDGSTDGTADVLGAIQDTRLRVLGEASGIGVAAGLNRLLDAAEGPFVARIDADDVTLPGRFAAQRRAIGAGADVTFAGHIRFGPSLRSFRQKRPWHLSPVAVRIWLALENPLLHPAMFGRTASIRAVGGYRPGPAEDYDLWMRLAAAGVRISRTLTPGLAYRMHPGQLTMGPGYLATLLRDPSLHDAHDALAGALGWTEGSVWPFLWVPTTNEADADRKARFWAMLGALSDEMPPFEGRSFRDALQRNLPGSTAQGFSAQPPAP